VKVYAFVFARGGSKGLPGKNIRKLGGIPLLGHSIRIAKQIPAVAKVLVSTDAQDIAQVAREYGAEVIERPPHLATDSVAEWLAWKHAIEYVRGRGEQFDVLLSLPATSPLRSVGDVENCLAALDDATDVVITVTTAGRNPYFNMVTRDERGYSSVVMQGKGFVRRQDAPQVYDITTVAYVARPDYVLRSSGLFEGRVKSVIVPKERAADIDDAYDFLVAEALYRDGSHRNGS
jgi:CMP-N-acetylneuraminic acid synthetase